jgi:uncharacterized membrane protein YgdD (TMEM256/DUF423 family)
LGAFGAHLLTQYLTEKQLVSWNTAVSYQFYHTLALALVGVLLLQPIFAQNKHLQRGGWAFLVGMMLFSGSIYLLALRDVLGIGAMSAVLGPLTPIGGVFFIIGWLLLWFGLVQNEKNTDNKA